MLSCPCITSMKTPDCNKSCGALSPADVPSAQSARLLESWWGSDAAAVRFLTDPFNASTVHVGGEVLGLALAKFRPVWRLRAKGLGPSHVEQIATLANGAITRLDLSANQLTERGKTLSGLLALCAAIRAGRLNGLVECDLHGNELGGDGWCAFLEALRAAPSNRIERVDLSGEPLSPRLADALAAYVGSSATLREVDLRGARPGVRGWRAIFLALRDHPHSRVASWDLSGQELDDEICSPLAAYLRSSTHLATLDLSGNPLISVAGVRLLSGAFRANSSVELVTLESGVPLSVRQLKGSGGGTDLASLSLASKGIGPLSLGLIAALVRCNPHLKQLNLADNRICGKSRAPGTRSLVGSFDVGGLRVLTDALRHCSSLTELNLSNNVLSNQGGDLSGLSSLGLALCHCPNLVRCNVSANELGLNGVKAIIECLSAASPLAVLDVSDNALDVSAERDLLMLLSSMKKERTLGPELRLLFHKGQK